MFSAIHICIAQASVFPRICPELAFQSLPCPTLGALQKSSAIIALIFGQGSLDPLLFPVFASACSPQDLCTGSSLTCSDSVVAGLNLPSNLSTDVTSYRAHTHTHTPSQGSYHSGYYLQGGIFSYVKTASTLKTGFLLVFLVRYCVPSAWESAQCIEGTSVCRCSVAKSCLTL